PPPLARIDEIERTPAAMPPDEAAFRIIESHAGDIRTGVAPDAATCPACLAEILDPAARRYRYPFTNCTHCGPRLSIIEAIPYDRATTTMRAFGFCPDCRAEYSDPADRRFHAQPIACAACGPRAWLEPAAGEDAIDAARALLLAGRIVAIKGLGGFHLACDATDAEAVARLRQAKRRDAKPFALMARDLAVIRRFAVVTAADAAMLQSPAAPIAVLDARDAGLLPGVAPGLATLGFMLPSTPLHHLLLRDIDRPLVMTSGNLSDEPQCIDNDEARTRLAGVADSFLLHDRDIARRVDDSLVRTMAGEPRVLRRARGYAPAPLLMARGFDAAPAVLAMGGELKNTFCLLRDGRAVLSHHMGDLENALAFADYTRSLEAYRALFAHVPRVVAVDAHPDYLSSKLGIELAARETASLIEVQHHHAHIAACMAENGVALDDGPVIGIALDGLGWGSDQTIWGGEFLLADYRAYRRLACLKPVAMPGGARAIREPWRNTYAQIVAAMGWERFARIYGDTALFRHLAGKPIQPIDGMIARRVNVPLASSCGRLFDAVAAAAGLRRDRAHYEGQAAMELEACTDPAALTAAQGRGYPFRINRPAPDGPLHLDPTPMWPPLLDDLAAGAPARVVGARFHTGLASAIAAMIDALRASDPAAAAATRVALSGGVLQNRVLLELLVTRLTAQGHQVLTHRDVPANDGGLALGQAAIAAARTI
ncbi:MAG: carbamoyltransferase HypF, partial [Pseudomonadota bacterium]|nr:carbamoyltransferase HypF [Pseudomonadota bacterium]